MRIEIPKNCPCCGYTLELIKDQLFCTNTACSAQLNKRIEHFTKSLGIKGFGPRTVEKLNLGDITEIFYLDRDNLIEALDSEKVADKLLSEIERAKSSDLATVLSSFSIPLIGNTASLKLAKVVSDIDEITIEKCKEAGLGDKATENLMTWLNTEYSELKEFLPFKFQPITINTEGPTICITGKLSSYKNKADATKILTERGFRVVESVTKTLKYLVDETDKGSAKRKKAEEYGVTIINNLNTFLKENT
jgi:DNA ligase (NAD+)